MQFVLPNKFCLQAMKACHDDMGHLGVEHSLDLLRDRFCCPSMANDVEKHVKTCDHCQCFKSKPHKVELQPIQALHPLKLIQTDFLTIESGKSNKEVNVLGITDHFIKYVQAYVTHQYSCQDIFGKYFVHYGFPEKTLSDQGRNSESSLIGDLCQLLQVKKQCNMPYQTNRQCERFNSTLISMLGTLPPEAKTNWHDQVVTLVHAYN